MAKEEKGLDIRAVPTPLEGVSDPVQQAAALKGLIHAGHFGPQASVALERIERAGVNEALGANEQPRATTRQTPLGEIPGLRERGRQQLAKMNGPENGRGQPKRTL